MHLKFDVQCQLSFWNYGNKMMHNNITYSTYNIIISFIRKTGIGFNIISENIL